MSDVSVLSHEYKTASELSQALNRSLITFKKARLGTAAPGVIPAEQLDASRRDLEQILETLLVVLDPAGSRRQVGTSPTRVPGALVARLQEARRSDLAYFLEDLERVVARLRVAPTKLSDEDIAVLDQLAAAADAETSQVFRRLMRT